jgi:hypothetical protein
MVVEYSVSKTDVNSNIVFFQEAVEKNHPYIMVFRKKNLKYMVTMLLFSKFPTEDLTVFQLFTPKNNNTMHGKLYKSQFLLSKKYDRTQYSSLVLLVQ